MTEIHNAAVGSYEPSLSMTVLRGCRVCGDRHPLAYTPPQQSDHCLNCGAIIADVNPETITVGATLTDGRARIGNALMRAGAALKRLSERI